MSNITRLNTVGSAGFKKLTDRNTEWENQKRINMFKIKGLYPMFLKLKVGSSGYILPGFDPSLAYQDTSRPMSVNAYRDINSIDEATMLPDFSNWVVFTDGYTYYGKGMSTFISPTAAGYKDPIIEMRKEVYRRKRQGDDSLNRLVTLPANATMQDKILLPGTATLALMNVWATGTNEREKDFNVYKNRVLCLKVTAWSVLADALNELRPATIATPRDVNWPHFLLGDVTDPGHAVRWTSTEHMDKNGIKSATLKFGKYTMQPGTMERKFECHAEELPAEALEGRYDLTDLVNVVHVPTPEEVVELLIEEGDIPYDFMAEVCEKFMDMPAPKRLTSKAAPAAPSYTAPTPQPAYVEPQPAPQAAATTNKHPWAQDDPEDDIPMEHPAPAATPDATAANASSALSAEEQAEMQNLLSRLASSNPPLGVPELIRLNELRKRANA
jgi:hypothetical protein